MTFVLLLERLLECLSALPSTMPLGHHASGYAFLLSYGPCPAADAVWEAATLCPRGRCKPPHVFVVGRWLDHLEPESHDAAAVIFVVGNDALVTSTSVVSVFV